VKPSDSGVERARMLVRDARAELGSDPRTAAELAVCERRLDEPLRVALAGTLKSGKSTLLNALVGEEIAPTDATECTRVVTWFTASPGPRIDLMHSGGRHTSLPVLRTEGRLTLDLGPVATDAVERLEVGWPSSLLRRYTLVDTPGTSSNSRDVSARTMGFLTPDDGPCPADAVVYLMRSLHSSDVALLRRMQSHAANGGALGIVGVLSRADETNGGRGLPLDAAKAECARLRAAEELTGLCRDFVAVSGLMALRGQTLRQREFASLARLAALDPNALDGALVSPDRFVRAELTVSAADRADLLAAFGMVGIRIATALVRDGASDSPALAAALVRHSGLTELRHTLDQRFGERAGKLKAHSVLRTVRAVLARHGGPRTQRLISAVDRELADTHAFTELRVLSELALLPVDEPTRAALDRALGGLGTNPVTRLGLPPDARGDHLRAEALRAIAHWTGRLADPLLDPRTARAFRAAVRSCEAIATSADLRPAGAHR
jgi:hypothetical protein